MANELRCDLCRAPATTVHLLPSLESVDCVKLSGECECDPGGYSFPIRQWNDGPPAWGNPSRRYTMRHHIEHAGSGDTRTLTLVDRRLGFGD